MTLTHAGRIGTAALALMALAACASPSQIHTQDGQTIHTADRPEVDPDKDFITYDRDGREVQINKSDVKSIEETP